MNPGFHSDSHGTAKRFVFNAMLRQASQSSLALFVPSPQPATTILTLNDYLCFKLGENCNSLLPALTPEAITKFHKNPFALCGGQKSSIEDTRSIPVENSVT
jgi:hypothetical protein